MQTNSVTGGRAVNSPNPVPVQRVAPDAAVPAAEYRMKADVCLAMPMLEANRQKALDALETERIMKRFRLPLPGTMAKMVEDFVSGCIAADKAIRSKFDF